MNSKEVINQEDISIDDIGRLADMLTDDEFAFCEQYMKDTTTPIATVVVKALPYEENPNKRGAVLLCNPNVIQYLDARRKIVRRTFMTKDDTLLKMRSTFEMCTRPIAVLDKRGHPTGEYMFDSKGAIKVLEMLGKHFGIVPTGTTAAVAQPVSSLPAVSVTPEQIKDCMEAFNEDH